MDLVEHLLPHAKDDKVAEELRHLGCRACISDKDWKRLRSFTDSGAEDVDLLVAEAVVAVWEGRYDDAEKVVEKARTILDSPISLTLADNVDRGAELVLQAQMLTELQEMVRYITVYDGVQRSIQLRSWRIRLQSSTQEPQNCETILALRSLVLAPEEQQYCYVGLSLMMVKQRLALGQSPDMERSFKLLGDFLDNKTNLYPPTTAELPKGDPAVVYTYIKNVWHQGNGGREQALKMLQYLVGSLTVGHHEESMNELLSRVYCRLGCWTEEMHENKLTDEMVREISQYHRSALQYMPSYERPWHHLALVNFAYVSQLETKNAMGMDKLEDYAAVAAESLFKAISLSSTNVLQDTLRLVRLWFTYGHLPKVL